MTVKLTAVAMYRITKSVSLIEQAKPMTPAGSLELVAGATTATLDAAGRVELTFGSVPLEHGVVPPSGGLLLLHGMYDPLESMSRYRAWAAAQGMRLATATYAFDTSPVAPSSISRSDLAGLTYVYVRQLPSSVQAELADHAALLSRSSSPSMGGTTGNVSPIKRLAHRPDLWDQLIDTHPDLRHLRVIVVPVADMIDYPTTFRQLAYVRYGTAYREVEHDASGVILRLPGNFPQLHSASTESLR